MPGFLTRWIVSTRRGRHWLRKLADAKNFQPIFDAVANRTFANVRTMTEMGFAPEVVLDVGAYRGDWTAMMRPIFPQARFIMFEAQPKQEAALRPIRDRSGGRVELAMGLLGAKADARVTFFMAETGSSIYQENTGFSSEAVTLPMATLDATVARFPPAASYFLKLDVQGAELDVLAGAAETLQRTDAVLMEVSLVEYNAGAPRIAEIVARMKALGFLLFDICDLRRIGPVLAQCDVIFVRAGGPMDQKATAVIRAYGK